MAREKIKLSLFVGQYHKMRQNKLGSMCQLQTQSSSVIYCSKSPLGRIFKVTITNPLKLWV